MKLFKRQIQLLIGILSLNFTAKANYGSNGVTIGATPQGSALENNNVFVDACKRLQELETKINLSADEIEEGKLLEEMVGQACLDPNEYKMASTSHLIVHL